MPATLVRTCPLCGLRFTNTSLLELHIREDHRPGPRRPAPDGGGAPDASDPGERAGGGPKRP